MNNIEDNFIPYKEALELKELGFNEHYFGNYADDEKHTLFTNGNRPGKTDTPLYQQAFRWLYKKLNIENGMMPLDIEYQKLILKELIENVKSKQCQHIK